VELSKEGTTTSDTFEKIAGKSFKKFVAEGGNTQQALQLLEKYAGKTNVGINDLFGSVEAGSAALSLTGKGTDTFSKNLDEMGKSAGATDGAFEQMNKGLGPLIDKVKAFGSVLLLDIGQKIAPIIIEIAGSFRALFAAFKSGNGDITSAGLAGTFERIGMIAREAFDLAVSGIKLMKDNLEIVLPIVGSLSAAFVLYKGYLLATATATRIAAAAQGAYNAVLLANPIGLLVVAIALLVAAVIILWRNWDQVFNSIKEHKAFAIIISILGGPILLTVFALVAAGKLLQANWETIWNAIQRAVQFAWSYIQPVWNGIMSFITSALIPALAFLGQKTVEIWGTISKAIGIAWDSVIKPIFDILAFYLTKILIPVFQIWWHVVSTYLTYIGEKIQRVWTDIIQPVFNLWTVYISHTLVPYVQFLWNVVQTVFSAIGTVINFVWNTMIKPAFDNIKYGIQTVWQFFQIAKDVISTVFSGIADGISGPFREAFNYIARAWNNTVGKLRWTIPRIVPVFGGDTIAAPTLPEFAKGGIFNAGMGGSGLAVLHDNEMVLNAEQQQGLFAGKGVGGGGSVYNINVNVSATADKAAIGQSIVESIAAYERRSGDGWRAA
jgi:Flp pilus assembly pilin Flp